MKLTRPLACIDLESTGTDPNKDRIVELGVCVLAVDGGRSSWFQRFNPGIPITDGATAVHGIKNEDVVDLPPFSDFARKIWLGLKDKDLAGYNLRRLDLPMIDEEFRRCGLALDLTDVKIIDAFGIFSKKEPRKLEDAVKRYCNREHAGAHGALSDATATLDVLLSQMDAYPDLGSMELDAIAKFSSMSEFDYADIARKLYRKDGELYWAFGKYRDETVGAHLDFAYWVLSKDFPGSTKEALEDEIARLEAKDRKKA